jgi:CheY-like chemotaxis protein
MKTHYKILWIDDDHRHVRGDKRALKSFLGDHGIELIIDEIEVTQDEAPTEQQSFKNAVSDLDLDMVFIDFNMPEKGNEIIHHIRKDLHHYYLPILFYTSDTNAQESLQKSILVVNQSEAEADKVADGIYFCDRDHITDKAKLILTSLLKKESRPQQTRGLLMDRVSEIDANITECIKKLWGEVPEDKQDKVLETLNERLNQAVSANSELSDQLKKLSYGDVAKFIEDNKKSIGTFAKAKILREVLRRIDNYKAKGQDLSDFCNDKDGVACLNSLRNIYAHDTEVALSSSHNDARCKFIREESRRHLDNLISLLNEAE